MVEAAIVAVFLMVYLGMILGGLPFLQLDRTGVALLADPGRPLAAACKECERSTGDDPR